MKRKITVIAAVLMAVVALAGCGKKATIHPIDIDGTTINVNETTVQSLIDGGFSLTYPGDDNQFVEIGIDTILDAESVYSGLQFGKDGESWGSIEVVTEAASELRKCVISTVTILEAGVSHAKLAGVALTDLTPEKAMEIEPNLKDVDSTQSSVIDTASLIIFRSEGAKGTVIKLEQRFLYDIDYSSEN